MWARIIRWLLPANLDEERQRIVTLLAFIITALAVGVPVYGVVILVDDLQFALPRAIALAVFVVFLVGIVHLLRQGYVRTVGMLMVAQMWLGLSFFVFIDRGINSPAFHWYTVIIIVAGLIMGIRGLLVATTASIILSLVAVLFSLGGIFAPREYDPVYIWALDVSAFVFTAFFLGLAVSGLTRSLRRARQAEATWRTLVEENPDLIYKVDQDMLPSAKPAHTEVKEMLSQVPDAEHRRVFDLLHRVFDQGQTHTLEYSTDDRVYSLRVNPISFENHVHSAIVTLRDITESRLAEEQRLQLAVETEKMALLQSLVADVTHDMKTPLATIETNLYLLKRTNPSVPPERLDRIRNQTRTLSAMVQNLLTIMRLDSMPNLQFNRVSLDDMCRAIRDEFSPIALQKLIDLTITVKPEARIICADGDELRRVLVNLLENALNYTPERGTVRLLAARQNGVIVIDVEDTGIGLSPSDLEHVFERFFRSDAARHRVMNGTGLGLAIVKRIVDMHGGTIHVRSAENEGTAFQIRLPQPDSCPPSETADNIL